MTGNTTEYQSDEFCSNQNSRIVFELVDTDTKIFTFNQIVKNYHKYKPTTNMVGRSINWLVKTINHRVIGAIGVGSSIMAIRPRDKFIGWTKEQRLRNLTKTCSNWRYCMIETGWSNKVLSLFPRYAQEQWRLKFGQKLVLMETLVEPPFTGNSYKANGWIEVGYTKGLQFEWKNKKDIIETDDVIQKHFKMGNKIDYNKWKVCVGTNTKKKILVKPLHRYWKKELCR